MDGDQFIVSVDLDQAFVRAARKDGSGSEAFRPLREMLAPLGAQFRTGEEYYRGEAALARRHRREEAKNLAEKAFAWVFETESNKLARHCRRGWLQENFVVVSADRKEELVREILVNPVARKFFSGARIPVGDSEFKRFFDRRHAKTDPAPR